jgi:carbonic anhydrase
MREGHYVALSIQAAMILHHQGCPGYGAAYAHALQRGPATVRRLWEWPSSAAQASKDARDLQWGASK